MSTIHIPSNTLRDAKKLFGRLKHLRCKLPVLNHLLLTAGQGGIQLAASDLDHWLETRISDLPAKPESFLIPPAAMEALAQSSRAARPGVAATMGAIADDEMRHASLAWQVAACRCT